MPSIARSPYNQGLLRFAPWEKAALSAALLAYLGLLIHLARTTGITVDEPSHIVSSILYWEGNDNLKPRDMPPLIKLIAGWRAGGAGFRLVEETHEAWRLRHEWLLAQDMVARTPQRLLQPALAQSRLPLLVFPMGTALLLWWWSRTLFGPLAAMVSLLLFLLEPTALGHAPLFKNDHAAAFTYLLFWYCAWRHWRSPGWLTAIALAFGLALACTAKLSMLVLLPITAAILVVRRCRAGFVVAPLVWLLLVAACQGELRWLYGIPFPAHIYDGAVSLFGNTQGKVISVYLLGKVRPQGHWAYFLVAAAVKAPEVLLVLVGAGAAILLVRAARGKVAVEDLLWILPGPLYFALASLTPLQFGFRLVLPALPFAILIGGVALQASGRSRFRLLGFIAPALMATALVAHYPHYISYFNVLSGGPRNALRYLSDSNIGWGQDLRFLKRYVQENKVPRLYVSYFGFDSVYAHLREDEVVWIQPPYGALPEKQYQPGPGLYAISSSLLTGQFFATEWRDYYKAFRDRKPIAYAGNSIYIYRFP